MARIHRRLTCLMLLIALVGAGCHKKPEKRKSAKQQREDAIQKANDEQAALDKFVAAVREILLWQQSQPVVASAAERQQTVKALAQKMEQVPVKGLPDDLSKAWEPMLKAWQALAKNPAPDAALRDQGAKAAEELNRQLAAHGVIGIRF